MGAEVDVVVVERVLAEHPWLVGPLGIRCDCGGELVSPLSSMRPAMKDHRAHVAEQIAAALEGRQ